jgi:TP901 family phage tail tape measure protein
MAGKNDIVAGIRLEGDQQFKSSVTSVNKTVTSLRSELNLVKAQYDGNQNSMEALTQKGEILNKILEQQKQKVEATKQGLENATRAYENGGKKIQEMEKACTAQEEKLEELNRTYQQAKQKLEELEKTNGSSSDAVKEQQEAVKKLEEELNDQNTAVAKAKTELSRCQSEYQKTGNKVEDWKTKLNNAEAQVIKANSAVAENARYMDEAAASADKCAKSIDAYGKAVKEPEKINTESLLKGAVIEKAVDIATNGLGQIAGAAKEAVTEIKKVGSSFEAAMSGVEGVSGATKQEVSQLSDKAKEIGANTKLSAEQAAGAMMNLSVAGWQVQETLDGVDGVVYLARAANMDLAESAQIAADNIATFNLQASDTTHIADMLAYAQAHSNTTASQLGQAYKNSAANMNAAGQTIETTTAILEALANNGLRSAESGTALAAVMRDMTSKMEDGAIAIGDTSVKVMDSRGNFRDMLDILKDVEKATNGMGDAQKQAALLSTFTSDSIKALNMMLNTGADEIAGYREELENCAGAAEEMGDTMDDNLEGATAAFNSAVESLEITIYEKFSGPLKAATEMATSAVSSITKAITPQKDAVNEVYDSIIESTEKLKDNVKSIGETFTGSMEEAQNVSDLAERLETLNEVENRTTIQKQEMADIVDTLSLSIPELKGAYDEENDSLSVTNDELEKLVKNYKKTAVEQALITANQDLYNQQLEATKQLQAAEEQLKSTEARKKLLENERDLIYEIKRQNELLNSGEITDYSQLLDYKTEALKMYEQALADGTITQEEFNAAQKELSNGMMEDRFALLTGQVIATDDSVGILGQSVETLDTQTQGLNKTVEENQKILDDSEKSIDANREAAEEMVGVTDDGVDALKRANGELPPLSENLKKQAKAISMGLSEAGKYNVVLGETGETAEESSGSILKWSGTVEDAGDAAAASAEKQKEAQQKAADAAKEAAEAQRTAAQEILDAYNSTRESIESSLQSKISLFDLFEKDDGGADVTTEAMNKNLNSQIEAIKKYKENLQKLREMTDEEGKSLVSPEFIRYIESLGMEGANALDHMVWTWENQGEYGAEQVRGISDNYMEAMDLKEEIGKTTAANTIAYKAGMKEFASSTEDFSDLRDAIEYAAQYAGEAWQGLTDETRTELENAIQTASACGAGIPEGLADSISSGATSPEQAIEMMNSAIEGQFKGLAKIAEENGISVPGNLKVGIEAGGQSAVDAYTELIELLAANNVDLETAGKEGGTSLGKGAAEGIKGETDNAKSTAQKVVESAQKVINDNAGAYGSAGKLLITAMAAGMTAFSYQVSNAAGSAVGSGAGAAAGYEGSYQAVGNQLAAGFARGIAQGKSLAINETINMAVQALNAAKERLKVASPSRRFRDEVGAQVAKGMAWGIKSNAVLAKNASTKMSQDVLDSATAWLDKYKEKRYTSLEDEKLFWEKVATNTKKGTVAYKKAQQEIADFNIKILKMQSAANKTVSGVSRTKTEGSGGKQKTVDKSVSEYYSDVYKAASKHLANMKVYYNLSVQDEEAYWAQVLTKIQKGTQAYTDVYEQWKNARNSGKSTNTAAAEEKNDYALNGGALDTYKQYFKVSERAEVDYWNTARKNYKRGTKEREEADKKYFAAKNTLNESLKNLEDDYVDKVTTVNSKLKEDIQDVADDLADSIADVTKETQEKIDELNKTYSDSVKSRQESIYNSMKLTDKFYSESDSGSTLLYNLKTQVVGLDDWKTQLQKLRDKGIDADFIKELEDMGPEASAMLHVLNNDLPEGVEGKGMTEAQLNEYVSLWRRKKEISQQEAEKENKDLKMQTEQEVAAAKASGDAQIAQLNKNSEQKIATLKANAQAEIKAYTEEYLKGVNDLEKPINASLQHIANQAGKIGESTVTKYVQSLYAQVSSKNAKSSLLNTTTTITTNLSKLTKDGEKIGQDTLDGILKAMNDSKKIKTYTTNMVKKIVAETKKAAKIKSPSRLMAEEVGEYIPAGVGAGIEENTATAIKPAQDMIRQLVESTIGKNMGNITLEQYLQRIDAGATQAASTAVQAQTQLPGINVDTGNLAGLLAQLIGEVQKVATNTAGSSQIVLDTGKLVGEITKPISQELALQSRAQSRGRF